MANVKISGAAVPFALPTGTPNGTEVYPADSVVSGVRNTYGMAVAALFGASAVSYATSLGLTYSGAGPSITAGTGATGLTINTPSDNQLVLNSVTGTYSTLAFQHASSLEAQIYWDHTSNNLFVGTGIASSTMKFTTNGYVQAFGANANQTFIVGKGTGFTSVYESALRAVLMLNGQTGGSGLIDFAVNSTSVGYVYGYSGAMSILSNAGSILFYPAGVLGVTIGSGGTLTAVGQVQGANFTVTGGTNANIDASPHTYGSITLSGSSAGYAGIQFTSAFGTQGRTLMVATASAIQGFYDTNAGAWDWYFNAGVLTVGTVPGASVTGTVANATTAATVSTTVASAAVGTTQATTTSNTTIATTAFAHAVADPTLTLAAAGRWDEVKGVQVRWGTITGGTDPVAVTYSTTFTTGTYSVVASPANSAGGNTATISSGTPPTATGFHVYTGGANGYYIAIGH
jgi:hypothetical protein